MSTIPRIQHNIAAMNAYRNYSANSKRLTSNLEKLSSGYRINRAGDDAAGLAISEKMRAQISGLTQAKKNATDGISLIQTAEGALTEVHDMLNRMVTLAEQSANGTYDDSVDRVQLQKEVDSLKSEINRIADSTNYNGIKLLDGSLSTEATSKSAAAKGNYLMLDAGDNTTTITKNVQIAAATKNRSQFATLAANSQIATDITGDAATKNGFTFDVRYLDDSGVEQTKTLTVDADAAQYGTADDVTAAIKNAIVNADIGFGTGGTNTAAAFQVDAKTSGSTGAKLLGITITKHGVDADGKGGTEYTDPAEIATDSTLFVQGVDEDRSNKIDFANAFKIGDTMTIGDKTYEIADPSGINNVKDGHVAIAAGLDANGVIDQASTMENLVNGLVANGVSARSMPGTAQSLYIDDLKDISIDRESIDVVIDSNAITSGNANATKSIAQFEAGKGTAAATNLTVKYLDADGNEQTRTLSYTATASAATNAGAMSNAINADDVLKKLFTTETVEGLNVGTKDNVRFTSIEKGANAPKVLGVVVNDAAGLTAPENKVLQHVSEGKDAAAGIRIGADVRAGDTVTVSGKTFEFVKAEDTGKVAKGNYAVVIGSDAKETAKNFNSALKDAGFTTDYVKDSVGVRVVENAFSLSGGSMKNKGGLTLQIGDTSDNFNKLTVSVNDMHVKSMGLDDVDISTQEGASAAMDKIKAAVNYVSDVRGGLGALQNRLDHTINNLGVMTENIQSAEGAIRDTDVAEEMMAYTKNNILNQAAQAMLAQANQLPQGVLQLLG